MHVQRKLLSQYPIPNAEIGINPNPNNIAYCKDRRYFMLVKFSTISGPTKHPIPLQLNNIPNLMLLLDGSLGTSENVTFHISADPKISVPVPFTNTSGPKKLVLM